MSRWLARVPTPLLSVLSAGPERVFEKKEGLAQGDASPLGEHHREGCVDEVTFVSSGMSAKRGDFGNFSLSTEKKHHKDQHTSVVVAGEGRWLARLPQKTQNPSPAVLTKLPEAACQPSTNSKLGGPPADKTDKSLPADFLRVVPKDVPDQKGRTCTSCALARRGSCGEPLAAGLGASHGIVWAPPGHAQNCVAFEPKLKAVRRPYRLAKAQAEAAHKEPWDNAAIGRFQRRLALLLRHGLTVQDAEDLGERLHLRDVDHDDRRCCLECSLCRSDRCADGEVFLPAQLQRCPNFKGVQAIF
jgi:hypothetical protein